MELRGTKGFAAWQVYLNIAFYIPFSQVVRAADAAAFELEKEEHGEKYERDDWTKEDAINWMGEQDARTRQLVFVDCLSQVYLDANDVLKLVSVHKDKNGIGISKHSVEGMKMAQLVELVGLTLEACFGASDGSLFF